jgi:phospholipase C
MAHGHRGGVLAAPLSLSLPHLRCGYGARLPFLVISPWAKRNFVDHTTTDQTSILYFIEDNWKLGRIDDLDHPGGSQPGQASFDQIAGSILNMFDFDDGPQLRPVILDRITGEVIGASQARPRLGHWSSF